MIAPGNNVIQLLFAVAFVIATGYALGRIHQWYRDGTDRDAAYRTGYDSASDGLIDLARREAPEPAPARTGGHGTAVTLPVRPGRRPDRRPVGDYRRRIGTVPAARAGRENAAR